MGRQEPVRHSAQCQASALQRQRHRARAARHHDQPADDDECLPQRGLRVRSRFRFLRSRRQGGVFFRRGRSHHRAAGQSHVGDQFRPRPDRDRAQNLGRPRRWRHQHHVRARRRHHARAYLGNAGRHLQERASSRPELPRHVRDRAGLLAALVRARQGFPPHRLEARHGAGAVGPAVPPAFQYRAAAGALSRHRGRRSALSDHLGEPHLPPWRRWRRPAGGVEERQGRRRPDRIRGSGSAHPPHLARGHAQERRPAEDGEIRPDARGFEGDRKGVTMTRLLGVAFAVIVALVARNATAADSALIEAAKKEGQVVWYTTLVVNQIVRPLKDAFEKKYPGVTLQYTRADDLVTAAKILAEGQAGRMQADILDSISGMFALQEAGLLAPFAVPNAADYPAELKAKDGYWTAVIMYVFTPGINTTLLPKDQAPKTFADLLDPKLKGKMAWNGSSMAGAFGFVANILTTMGEDKGMDYLRALAKQQVVNVDASSRAVLDQVIAGEYWINLMAFNHHTVISARKGAPSDWLKIEPAPVTLDAVGLVKDAPHPNATRLLLEFLLSEDGQKVFQQNDYLPALPSVPAMVAGLRPNDGGFQADFLRPEEIHKQLPHWQKVTQELFR